VEIAGRRVAKFAEVMQSVWDMEHDYERRVKQVFELIKITRVLLFKSYIS